MTAHRPTSDAPTTRGGSPRGLPQRAAPAAARVRSQARFDLTTTLRNGEQLLVSVVLPALALIGLTLAPFPQLEGGARVDVAMPGVIALAILSSAFTGQAIGTGFDRRYGVLRLLGTTPLGRRGFLSGRVAAVLAIQVVQFVVLAVVGLALGWQPSPASLLPFLVFWPAGTGAFVALALLFAGTLRAEAVLALANLLWVLMAGAGGVLISGRGYPAPWPTVVDLLPPGALGDGMRAAFLEHTLALGPLAVLSCWGVLFAALAIRSFRWSD